MIIWVCLSVCLSLLGVDFGNRDLPGSFKRIAAKGANHPRIAYKQLLPSANIHVITITNTIALPFPLPYYQLPYYTILLPYNIYHVPCTIYHIPYTIPARAPRSSGLPGMIVFVCVIAVL